LTGVRREHLAHLGPRSRSERTRSDREATRAVTIPDEARGHIITRCEGKPGGIGIERESSARDTKVCLRGKGKLLAAQLRSGVRPIDVCGIIVTTTTQSTNEAPSTKTASKLNTILFDRCMLSSPSSLDMVCRFIHPPASRLLQGLYILPNTGWRQPSALPVSPLDVVIYAEGPPYGPTFPQQRAPRLTTSMRFHLLYRPPLG
jgi:hypothetical protein